MVKKRVLVHKALAPSPSSLTVGTDKRRKMIKLNGRVVELKDVALFAHNNSVSHIEVKLQSGPIKEVGIDGVQIDDVVELTKNIIEGFNIGHPCRENSIVITKLDEALMWLNKRTKDREARGVEGTHQK